MSHIEFIDQTLRDGPQSLGWAEAPPGFYNPILPVVDRVGYRVVDLTGGSIFTARLAGKIRAPQLDATRQAADLLPSQRIRAGIRTLTMVGFGFNPPAVVDLTIKVMTEYGVRSFWVYDCLYGMDEMKRVCSVVRDNGAEVVPSIFYGLTNVHTDEFFADRARDIASWGFADAIYFEDAPGVLTPERAATLIPAVLDGAGDVPVELHCHNTTGVTPLVYLEGVRRGITILHTALRPMANGPSLPSTEQMIENLEALGHSHGLDASLFGEITQFMSGIARQYDLETGSPREYSLLPYQHQIPGGMTGTLKAQLRQHGMLDRFPDVLEELAKVREDLGQPIMATPFSQLVGIQAVLNIVAGERYKVVPNEIVQYAMGHYGTPLGVIAPDVLDRIMSQPAAKHFKDWTRPDDSIADLRRRFGKSISDAELLYRALNPEDAVEAMLALPSAPPQATTASNIVKVVHDLAHEAKQARSVAISGAGYSVMLKRHAPAKTPT